MSETISTFTIFSATVNNADEVNSNFDNLRGSRIPISSSQAAASTGTYKVGNSSTYWRDLYIKGLYLDNTTTGWNIVANSAGTSLLFTHNSTSPAEFQHYSRVSLFTAAALSPVSQTYAISSGGWTDLSGTTLTIPVDTVANNRSWFFRIEGTTAGSTEFEMVNFTIGVAPTIRLAMRTTPGNVQKELYYDSGAIIRNPIRVLGIESGLFTSTGYIERKLSFIASSSVITTTVAYFRLAAQAI